MQGFRSPKLGHLGVYYICTGPDPKGPFPGERFRAVVYDAAGNVIRRFEQIKGACVYEGYVDGFNVSRCQPSRYEMPLVDIAPDGKVTTLLADFQPHMSKDLFASVLTSWATTHGKAQ